MFLKLITGVLVAVSAVSWAETAGFPIPTHGPAMTAPAAQGDAVARIDKETLYNLLAAEFAIYRNQYDKALDFYLPEARNINDSSIAARAAQLAMYQKKYVEMLEAAAIWQRLAPNDPQPYFFLSLGYSLTQQPNLALENMRKVLTLGGETDFTRLVNGLPEGHPSEAFFIHELYQATESHPDSFDLPLALALLYHRQNQSQLALTYVDMAVAKAKGNHAVISMAVRLYLRYNQPAKAMEAYRKALAEAPDDNELRLAFAQFAMPQDIGVAQQQFEILLEQDPDNDYLLLNLGLIYLEQEQLQPAETLFARLVYLKKRSSVAHYYLGQIYYYQGEYGKAMNAFAAITSPEEIQRSAEIKVRILLDQKQTAEAAQVVDQALQAPIDTLQKERLQVLKSMVLHQQGDTRGAFQLLSQLLDLNPDSIELRYSRAMLAETENELSQMESDLRHIINIRPDNALALNALGYTLANKTDRYREAYQLIEKAHQLLPEDPAVLDSMGWVLFRMGKMKEAIQHLQHAMRLLPDAEIAAHLGEVLWISGNRQEARRVFREALETTPGNPVITETLKRLDVTL